MSWMSTSRLIQKAQRKGFNLNKMGAVLQAFIRQKDYTPSPGSQEIPRVLNTLDLTILGVGGTLGAGVYVVTADLAKHIAGPGAIISFILAAIIFLPNAMCYAEFSSRIPKAGSAYAFTYVALGEISAFLVGWNLLLQYLIGAAAISRAWSSVIDSLAENEISNNLMENVAHWKTQGISKYPDFLALVICVLTSVVLAAGMKISSYYNMVLTFINLVIILFLFIMGVLFMKGPNWGNFFPYGFNGAFSGAAVAFFAFVGTEIITVAAEETKNPQSAVPKAIFISMLCSVIAYLMLTIALTLLVPSTELSINSALAEAFHERGILWAKHLIAVGALAGLTSSLCTTMYPVTRILFSMGNDGLLFFPFSGTHKATNTPVFSTLFSGMICGWLGLYFELSHLIEMMSIGTLQAYTIVATCVLLIRYRVTPIGYIVNDGDVTLLNNETLVSEADSVRMSPTRRTFFMVSASMFLIILLVFMLALLLLKYGFYVRHGYFIAMVAFFILVGAITVAITVIALQPQNCQNTPDLPFTVPLVPVLPVFAIFINIFLMMQLKSLTWARFTLWMAIGLFIYMFYGVQHSKEDKKIKE